MHPALARAEVGACMEAMPGVEQHIQELLCTQLLLVPRSMPASRPRSGWRNTYRSCCAPSESSLRFGRLCMRFLLRHWDRHKRNSMFAQCKGSAPMNAPATVRKPALRTPTRLSGRWLPTWNRRCERTAAPLTTARSVRPRRSRPGMLF